MLSMHSEQTLVRQALAAGRARLHPQERASISISPAAVKRVAAGETVLDPALERPRTLQGERATA